MWTTQPPLEGAECANLGRRVGVQQDATDNTTKHNRNTTETPPKHHRTCQMCLTTTCSIHCPKK